MTLDKKLISKLEDLSMLRLSEQEREEIAEGLEKMIGMIDKIREFDPGLPEEKIEAQENIFREDIIGESMNIEEAFRNSKNTKGRYFTVPKVIKQNSDVKRDH